MPEWLNSAREYIGLFLAVIAALGVIWQPIRKVLAKSKETMLEMREALKEQEEINNNQKRCIKESQDDREKIHTLLRGLTTMSQTQAQIEITKIAQRCLARGKITAREKATLKPLWEAYSKDNGWNHIRSGDVDAALHLPLLEEKDV